MNYNTFATMVENRKPSSEETETAVNTILLFCFYSNSRVLPALCVFLLRWNSLFIIKLDSDDVFY